MKMSRLEQVGYEWKRLISAITYTMTAAQSVAESLKILAEKTAYLDKVTKENESARQTYMAWQAKEEKEYKEKIAALEAQRDAVALSGELPIEAQKPRKGWK